MFVTTKYALNWKIIFSSHHEKGEIKTTGQSEKTESLIICIIVYENHLLESY
jgi:hypothetical protein